MSAMGIMEETVGARKAGNGVLVVVTGEEEGSLIGEQLAIDMAREVPSEWAIIEWTSTRGPLSWTVPGTEALEEATKVMMSTSIWDKPNILAMLSQPIGAPVSLTRDEALEIARHAFGSSPDLPPGEDFVRQVRPLIGRSILRKLKKSHG